MAEASGLVVATPQESDVPTGIGGSPTQSSPRDLSDRDELDSGEEQSAAAALLGLHSAWPSSPDDESRDDDSQGLTGVGYDAASDLWDATNAAAGRHFLYDLHDNEPYSPKMFRHHPIDYDTPGHPSPKRMRAPKDGAPRHPPPSRASARPSPPPGYCPHPKGISHES